MWRVSLAYDRRAGKVFDGRKKEAFAAFHDIQAGSRATRPGSVSHAEITLYISGLLLTFSLPPRYGKQYRPLDGAPAIPDASPNLGPGFRKTFKPTLHAMHAMYALLVLRQQQ